MSEYFSAAECSETFERLRDVALNGGIKVLSQKDCAIAVTEIARLHDRIAALEADLQTAPDLAARVARLEGLLSRAQPSHSHSIKCRDSNSDENCLRCAIDAAPPSAAQPVARVSVQRYKGHNGYENCDWEWNVDIPPDGNYVLYTAPPDLAAKVARLEDALRGMLELAEYWFMRENRRGYSEEQYKAWYSLGFDSNEFKNARAALARWEA